MKKKSSKKLVGITLGSLVKDMVTGFTGIATSRTEYLYGCVHIGITSRNLDIQGTPVGAMCFDEQRIIIVDKRDPVVSPDSKATSGGPVPGALLRQG